MAASEGLTLSDWARKTLNEATFPVKSQDGFVPREMDVPALVRRELPGFAQVD